MGAKRKSEGSPSSVYSEPPAQTAEAREQQLACLAYNLVEERLKNGTASSAETVHFLKLGSTKERLEREKSKEEIKLLKAKTEELQAAKKIEELYSKAIEAFGIYNGEGNVVPDDDNNSDLYRTD